MLYDCCPDRVRGVLDAGATRLGLHAAGGRPGEVAGLIDHTLLKPDATRAEIETLCREAAEFRFATRLREPDLGGRRPALLRGTPVGVCSVVGFPLGATTADVKALRDAARGLRRRPRGRHGDQRRRAEVGRPAHRRARHRGGAEHLPRGGALSKVIIEAALLTDEEKITACTLAKAAGADYVKTSTGFGQGGATVADVALMRRVVGARWA